jgi:hypothetical protein
VAGEPVPVPPSAPLAVRVLPGPNRLSVTWTAPASDGGAPVGSYLARAYRTASGGTPFASCAATGTGRSCVLTGLPGGARVYVGVIARNPAGAGPEPVVRPSATTWTVAGPPRSVRATSSRGRVTVTWAVPATSGGTPVSGYRAELYTAVRGGNPAVRCTAAATARTCVTAALTPGRTYYASVTAANAVGLSAQPTRVKVLVRR